MVYLGREERGNNNDNLRERGSFLNAIVTLLSFVIGNFVILSTLIYFRLCER